MDPLVLAAKVNSVDNPTWSQAMNGPDESGFWQACEDELETHSLFFLFPPDALSVSQYNNLRGKPLI